MKSWHLVLYAPKDIVTKHGRTTLLQYIDMKRGSSYK